MGLCGKSRKRKYKVLDLDHNKNVDKWLNNVTQAIRNRGIFMSAMLRIATIDKKYDIAELDKDDKIYDGWKVSNIYKKLMVEVFTLSEAFEGYEEVFTRIKNCLEEKPCDEAKAIIKKAKNLLVKDSRLTSNTEENDEKLSSEQGETNMKNSEKWEDFIYDIIKFCIKWGLWYSVVMWTKEKNFISFEYENPEEKQGFRDLTSVWVSPRYPDEDEELSEEEMDFPEPENVILYYEGETPLAYLFGLFGYRKYCVELQYVSQEAFEFILQYEYFDSEEITVDSDETGELELYPVLEKWEFDSYNEFEELEEEIDYDRWVEIKEEKRNERVSYEKGTEVYTKVLEEFNAIMEKHNVRCGAYGEGYEYGLQFYEK